MKIQPRRFCERLFYGTFWMQGYNQELNGHPGLASHFSMHLQLLLTNMGQNG